MNPVNYYFSAEVTAALNCPFFTTALQQFTFTL